MNNIRYGDLAIVVQGMWPNIGRVVYVASFSSAHDFRPMGLGIRDAWRVRSWGDQPLETTAGPRMCGFTPVGSLRRLDPLPPLQRAEIVKQMAEADIKESLAELARILKEQYEVMAV